MPARSSCNTCGPGIRRPRSLLPHVPPGVQVDGGQIELVQGIVQGSEKLGTIYLRAQYDITGRVRAYLSVLGAVMLIGLIAALLAGAWLQRVVSQPMESMANVARQIVERRDYSFRAGKTTDDEIGVVVDAFNNMLDEVQAHSRALETSEKLYRAIGESINYGVWVTDAGRPLHLRQRLLPQAGRPHAWPRPPTMAGAASFTRMTRPTRWPPGRNARAPATSGTASTA